jgi:hypothetical protein
LDLQRQILYLLTTADRADRHFNHARQPSNPAGSEFCVRTKLLKVMHGTSYSRVILKGDVSCKFIYLFFVDLLFSS